MHLCLSTLRSRGEVEVDERRRKQTDEDTSVGFTGLRAKLRREWITLQEEELSLQLPNTSTMQEPIGGVKGQ